ncbi:MAG: RtcB family protein [Candidatus Omnitrophica bacterium]|nr:RtcB family protein [Candidatus Omnitrophota bacterium]MCM8810727.1 RtcB family protein [Candidatus Omnitrophota bacterium]
MSEKLKVEKINEYKWIIPKVEDMRVPGVIFISEKLLKKAIEDKAVEQVANVARLPGIVKYSLAMPDVHWGYGAPIGGVGAFNEESGVIVPGFVGYDINCGVRLIRTDLTKKDIENKLKDLVDALFYNIPSGVGSTGKLILKRNQLEEVCVKGARWAIENGYGKKEDLENIEEYGCIEGADPSVISDRAYERGLEQSGTLGSGNHFLEIQEVINVYDEDIAEKFKIFPGQITIMVHTGSRGFGYQICDDFLDMFGKVVHKYGIKLPDRQLACAPASSPEGQKYFKAMKCAANYAFANRQVIYYWICETFEKILKISAEKLGIETVYDVAHNICKFETHTVNGNKKKLYVHRKGATRAFPKGHNEISEKYRDVGQPVIIPGTMGTASYVLVGTEKAMEETFGSTCHGAGRMMSRSQAIKQAKGRSISKELLGKGIIPKAVSEKGLAEEMPSAYKDVDEVIKVVEGAGISKKVAKMIPLAVIKG